MRIGDGRVELLAPLGDGHAGRPLPRQARARDAPRRLRGRATSTRRSRELAGAGAELIDERAAAGALRARGRVRPSGLRPRRSLGGGVQVAEPERVRIEIAFDGGQIMGASSTLGRRRRARAGARSASSRGHGEARWRSRPRTAATRSPCGGSSTSSGSRARAASGSARPQLEAGLRVTGSADTGISADGRRSRPGSCATGKGLDR